MPPPPAVAQGAGTLCRGAGWQAGQIRDAERRQWPLFPKTRAKLSPESPGSEAIGSPAGSPVPCLWGQMLLLSTRQLGQGSGSWSHRNGHQGQAALWSQSVCHSGPQSCSHCFVPVSPKVAEVSSWQPSFLSCLVNHGARLLCSGGARELGISGQRVLDQSSEHQASRPRLKAQPGAGSHSAPSPSAGNQRRTSGFNHLLAQRSTGVRLLPRITLLYAPVGRASSVGGNINERAVRGR